MADDQQPRSAIMAEALEWFVRNHDDEQSAEEREAFGIWLKSSPLHVEEYLRTAVVSKHLRAAITAAPSELGVQSTEAHAPDGGNVVSLSDHMGEEGPAIADVAASLHVPRPPRSTWFTVAAAVLLVSIGSVVIWMWRDGQRFGLPKEFITAHGEQRSWLLPDGSGLSLSPDSAVIVHFGKRERVVEVERGRALFRVAHERGRRFQVVAGRAVVIAVGTEFDVLRSPQATVVTVVEGRVAVFTGNVPPPTTAEAGLPAKALSVGAGQQVSIDDDAHGAAPAVVVKANVEQAVAWTYQEITFDQQALGDVAAEFSRYSPEPIIVESRRLRALPISGVLNMYDTDSFLAFIAKLHNVEITRLGDRIVVRDKDK